MEKSVFFIEIKVFYKGEIKQVKTKNRKKIFEFLENDVNQTFDFEEKNGNELDWVYLEIKGKGHIALEKEWKVEFMNLLLSHFGSQFGEENVKIVVKKRYLLDKRTDVLKDILGIREEDEEVCLDQNFVERVDFFLNENEVIEPVLSVDIIVELNLLLGRLKKARNPKFEENIILPISLKNLVSYQDYLVLYQYYAQKNGNLRNEENIKKKIWEILKPYFYIITSNVYDLQVSFAEFDNCKGENLNIFLNEFCFFIIDKEGNFEFYSYENINYIDIGDKQIIRISLHEEKFGKIKEKILKFRSSNTHAIVEDIAFYASRSLKIDAEEFYACSHLLKNTNQFFELEFERKDFYIEKSIHVLKKIVKQNQKKSENFVLKKIEIPFLPGSDYTSLSGCVEHRFKKKKSQKKFINYEEYLQILKKIEKMLEEKFLKKVQILKVVNIDGDDDKESISDLKNEIVENLENKKKSEKPEQEMKKTKDPQSQMSFNLSKALSSFPKFSKKKIVKKKEAEKKMNFRLSSALSSFPGKKKKS